MDIVYLLIAAACWGTTVALARGCARLQARRGRR